MKDEIKEILEYYKRTNKNHFGYEQDKIITYKEAQILLDYITNLQEENERLEKINGVALTYNKHLMLCERQRHNLQHLKQMESILKGEGLK